MFESKRKGARSTKDIPADILYQLNEGTLETANLVEWLAVDQKLLLDNLLKQHKRTEYLEPILLKIDQLKKQTVNTVNEVIGATIFDLSQKKSDQEFLSILADHQADLVRCWATYTIGKNSELSISAMLTKIQPFAADHHFGVREICWMAVRPTISKNLIESIEILSSWTLHSDENIRRFTTESIRPRGVWCEHIEELKQNPNLALPILENLKSDSAKYVQDSVANWLNDASKSQPEFVKQICMRWKSESDTKATNYIVKKALRTLNK